MKKKLIITIDEDIKKKIDQSVPPSFRSFFIQEILRGFFQKNPPETVKKEIFKTFSRNEVKERIQNLFVEKSGNREFKTSKKKSDKIPQIDEEINEMW